MDRLDKDGNGFVDVDEFLSNCPAEVAAAIDDKCPRVPYEAIQKAMRKEVGVKGF